MFQTIKDNFAMAVIALLTIAVIVSGAMWAVTAGKLSTANASLTNEIAAKAVIQTDLDNATVQLKAAEIEKERLLLDAALTAKTLTVREQGRNTVETELMDTKAKAKAVMESSTDEADKSWTIAAVPDELNRLLKQRSYCANRNNDQDSVCITASAINERMQHSSIHGPNQSRSL
ncbi:hypothetical protein K5M76_09525 [Shewanella xiamenensis]|nr:hypothetical protein [Shewanella xiamenensis]UWG66429.1 hypothetical protein K5M76_09525 [Shewanella xiamenensis]